MHQLFIVTSLQLLLPVIQTILFSVPRFSIRRNKNPQKLNVFFLDQNRRNFTPQKLPVIRYIYFVKILTWLNIGCMNNQVCDTCSGEWYRPRWASSNLFLFWLFSDVLSKQQLFHMTYKMYIFSLYTNCFGLFILVIGYGKYANTGYEETGAWLAGKHI